MFYWSIEIPAPPPSPSKQEIQKMLISQVDLVKNYDSCETPVSTSEFVYISSTFSFFSSSAIILAITTYGGVNARYAGVDKMHS